MKIICNLKIRDKIIGRVGRNFKNNFYFVGVKLEFINWYFQNDNSLRLSFFLAFKKFFTFSLIRSHMGCMSHET